MQSEQFTLAELGYKVFPIVANSKKPLTEHGFKDATTDAEQIERWSEQWPNANWAIECTGLLVLDVDGADNEWFKSLGERAADLMVAPVSLTPSGGRHFLFRAPDESYRNTQSEIAPKVDTRANGGYIVVAPSSIDGKAYRWLDDNLDVGPNDLPLPPQWLIESLTKKPTPTWQAIAADKIPDGLRNKTLFRLACCLRRPGLSQAEISAALKQANADRCQTPLDEREVERIAQSAAGYSADASTVAGISGGEDYGPIILNLAGVKELPINWLWEPRIPLGTTSCIVGVPGLGKSYLSMYLAACVTTGRPWTDRPNEEQQVGGVVILSAEDDVARTIVPRLKKHDADLSRINAIEAVKHHDGKELLFNLERDLEHLESAIARTPNCRFVVIDPISAYCGKVKTHNDAEVRGLLAPLKPLAEKTQTAIVYVGHLNKSQEQAAINRMGGSIAFIAAARASWLIHRDRDDNERRLMVPQKLNLTPNPDGLAFTIKDGIVTWEPDKITLTADEVLSGEAPRGPTLVQECMEWLTGYLASGPVSAAEGTEAATANGFKEGTLGKAKRKLGVVHSKSGFDGGWTWALPVPA